jgi:hypothetical protein
MKPSNNDDAVFQGKKTSSAIWMDIADEMLKSNNGIALHP